jgi:hypothetical protein
MVDQDKADFVRLLEMVFSLHGRSLSTDVTRLYWQSLKHYSLKNIRQAMHQHTLNPEVGQFCPKPADVVRQLTGTQDAQAQKALSQVLNALRTVGTYDSVVFDDPIIHCAISDTGGWIRWGNATDDDIKFRLAKEFEISYRNYVGKPLPDYPDVLIGITQARNQREGFIPQNPVLVDHRQPAISQQPSLENQPEEKSDDMD